MNRYREEPRFEGDQTKLVTFALKMDPKRKKPLEQSNRSAMKSLSCSRKIL